MKTAFRNKFWGKFQQGMLQCFVSSCIEHVKHVFVVREV